MLDATKKAVSVSDFCAAFGFSKSHYYALKRSSLAPREMRTGPRQVRITAEAVEEWQRARERDATISTPVAA